MSTREQRLAKLKQRLRFVKGEKAHAAASAAVESARVAVDNAKSGQHVAGPTLIRWSA